MNMQVYEQAQEIRYKISKLYDLKHVFSNYRSEKPHQVVLLDKSSNLIINDAEVSNDIRVKLIKFLEKEISALESEFSAL